MNKNKEEKSIWEIIGNLVLFFLFIDAISDIFNIFNDNEWNKIKNKSVFKPIQRFLWCG